MRPDGRLPGDRGAVAAGTSLLLAGLLLAPAIPGAEAWPDLDRAAAVWPAEPAGAARVAEIDVVASLDPAARSVTGRQRLRWRNPGAAPVDELVLRLTLNAFASEGTTFHREARGRFRRPFGELGPDDWGWLEVTAATVDGVPSRVACRSPDDGNPDDCTVAGLELPAPAAPGETVEVELAFVARLPKPIARTGLAGSFALLGHVFPRPARFDPEAGGFRIHQHHAATEFSADFGVWHVALEHPEGWRVEATGLPVAREPAGRGWTRSTFVARDVLDFAAVAGAGLAVAEGAHRRADGSTVPLLLLHPPDRADAARGWLRLAERALAALEARLGPYPWPRLVLVEPPRGAEETGAMEYPGLVTLGERSRIPGAVLPRVAVLVHELAHQWFPMAVATDEAMEAWLDEGLVTHVTGLVLDRDLGLVDRPAFRGFGLALPLLDVPYRWGDLARAGLRGPLDPIHQPAWRFPDFEAYGLATYLRADLVLRTAEGLVGREAWATALRAWADEGRFRHPTGDDFLAVISRASGRPDLGEQLAPLLLGPAELDLAVEAIEVEDLRVRPPGAHRRADGTRQLLGNRGVAVQRALAARLDGGRHRTLVTVRRTGPPLPATVRVDLADGTSRERTWSGPGPVERLAFVAAAPGVRATIDPERRIALDLDRSNDARDLEPSALLPARWTAAVLAACEAALALLGGLL